MSMTIDASPETSFPPVLPPSEGDTADPWGPRRAYLAVRTIAEFGLAAVLLVIAGPIMLLCAVLVKLTSRGPAFYSQMRLGLGGKPSGFTS